MHFLTLASFAMYPHYVPVIGAYFQIAVAFQMLLSLLIFYSHFNTNIKGHFLWKTFFCTHPEKVSDSILSHSLFILYLIFFLHIRSFLRQTNMSKLFMLCFHDLAQCLATKGNICFLTCLVGQTSLTTCLGPLLKITSIEASSR